MSIIDSRQPERPPKCRGRRPIRSINPTLMIVMVTRMPDVPRVAYCDSFSSKPTLMKILVE